MFGSATDEIKIYPRLISAYREKQSLDFGMMRTKIFLDCKQNGETAAWFTHAILGVMMGFLCFGVSWAEHLLDTWKFSTVQAIVTNHGNYAAAYFFLIFISVCFVLVAALLTVFVQPKAQGSGVAEIMGFLNGVNYKGAIGIDTLCVKVVGVVFAICSGLCIGDEGPLAHMGAILGVLCCYLPFEWCKLMQNDCRKRQMIAAGAAVGLSCAFGAPIGGALFSYEISNPNTFWTFKMMY